MTKNGCDQAFGNRLAKSVTSSLGIPATFLRWIESTTGDVPVFLVQAEHVALATSRGLKVQATA